jgi:hypothetical protein
VVIPAEDTSGRVRTYTALVDFQIDTGSDVTTIARADFEGALGLSLEQAPRGLQSVGIGAAVMSRAIWGYLFFDDEVGGRALAAAKFVVLETAPDAQMHRRSLLGLDVLLRGRLTLDRANILFDLPVVTPTA